MRVIATTTISGPEANGLAKIVENNDSFWLEINNFDVAQGAPDVHVAMSSNEQGEVNENVKDISSYRYGNFSVSYKIPDSIDIYQMKTVIVYCKQFFAHFGHGNWKFAEEEA